MAKLREDLAELSRLVRGQSRVWAMSLVHRKKGSLLSCLAPCLARSKARRPPDNNETEIEAPRVAEVELQLRSQ